MSNFRYYGGRSVIVKLPDKYDTGNISRTREIMCRETLILVAGYLMHGEECSFKFSARNSRNLSTIYDFLGIEYSLSDDGFYTFKDLSPTDIGLVSFYGKLWEVPDVSNIKTINEFTELFLYIPGHSIDYVPFGAIVYADLRFRGLIEKQKYFKESYVPALELARKNSGYYINRMVANINWVYPHVISRWSEVGPTSIAHRCASKEAKEIFIQEHFNFMYEHRNNGSALGSYPHSSCGLLSTSLYNKLYIT